MKSLTIALALALSLPAAIVSIGASAQQPAAATSATQTAPMVTVSAHGLTLRGAVNAIAAAAGREVENIELTADTGKYDIGFEEQSADKALRGLLTNTGIQAKLERGKIVLSR